MARFLPALRGKAFPVEQYATTGLDSLNAQQKGIVGQYLSAFVSSYGLNRRSARWEIERAVHEGYERIVWVYKSVDAIAGNVAALPLTLLDKANNEVEHPLLDLLNGPKANPLETGQEFRERLSAQFLLSRRGVFVEITMARRGTPLRVDLLPPGRTQIIPGDRDDPIRNFKVTLADGAIRYLDREQVLWFRKPHPTDPFGSMTPLEAAGLATELDYFADLYNANFMRNDGRPGGILAVKNSATGQSMSDPEMDRIEARFGKGPVEAGKFSVISGDMTFIDPAGKPRDLAYAELSDRAKVKILTAFGLDESIVGDTSGKTFANAEQAWENFWLLDPMPAHMRMVSNGWARLPGLDDLHPGFDTSEVEPLRRARANRLEEARAEVAAGVRTIKSYADLAGYGDEIEDTPQTRALWMPAGLTPIPSREADKEELAAAAGPPTTPGQAAGPGQPGALPAAHAIPALPRVRSAAQAVQEAQIQPAAAPAAIGASPQGKQRAHIEVKAMPRRPRPRLSVARPTPMHVSEPDEEASRAAETALAEALTVLADRFVERTVARLQSPKLRKGTKHWTAEYEHDTRIGTKALDTAKAADEDTWASEAQTVAQPYVEAAAAQAAQATAADLDADGHPVLDAAVTAAAVAVVLDLIGESARRQARRLSDALNVADQAGQSLAQLVGVARGWGDRLHGWARGLSTQATVAVTEGARVSVLRALADSGLIPEALVRRVWVTRHDERVRATHRAADGQTTRLGRPFVVGGALLRFPGDPLGPPAETAGCRCRVRVEVASIPVALAG